MWHCKEAQAYRPNTPGNFQIVNPTRKYCRRKNATRKLIEINTKTAGIQRAAPTLNTKKYTGAWLRPQPGLPKFGIFAAADAVTQIEAVAAIEIREVT